MRLLPVASAGLIVLISAGCVRRHVDITSVPDGALVKVNGREVGRTPCRVEFDHYGDFDVVLTKEGFETVVGVGSAKAPVWDWAGVDLIGELAPFNLVSGTKWDFHMVPAGNDPELLVRRAQALRSDLFALEAQVPVERVPVAPPDAAATARRDGERGVVPTPPTVLEPSPSAPASAPAPAPPASEPAPSGFEPAPIPGTAPPSPSPD